jgi:carbonic anhydrase
VARGTIFCVRVAGNVVSGVSVKGSLEFAVQELGVRTILVLGHTNCGAVQAAIAHLDKHDALVGSMDYLVRSLQPAVSRARRDQQQEKDVDPRSLLVHAIRANVLVGVKRLRHLEPILAKRVRDGQLEVVGAIYDLATGRVNIIAETQGSV